MEDIRLFFVVGRPRYGAAGRRGVPFFSGLRVARAQGVWILAKREYFLSFWYLLFVTVVVCLCLTKALYLLHPSHFMANFPRQLMHFNFGQVWLSLRMYRELNTEALDVVFGVVEWGRRSVDVCLKRPNYYKYEAFIVKPVHEPGANTRRMNL